ncbi:MAG: YceI family protein [Vicinamibacterales bacterium]
MRTLLHGVVVLTMAAGSAGAVQTNQEFRIDPAATSVVVHVGRAGLFKFAGHDHEVAVPGVAGRISLDSTDPSRSRVALQFDAKALKVTGKGEPAVDVAEVQRTMLSERVLDVARYPTISFESDRVVVQQRSAGSLTLRVDGRLTLHGVTKTVTVPVAARLNGNRMTATGEATVRQSDFGIRPVSAGGGTVRVKDDVDVMFSIVAVAGGA